MMEKWLLFSDKYSGVLHNLPSLKETKEVVTQLDKKSHCQKDCLTVNSVRADETEYEMPPLAAVFQLKRFKGI